MFIKRFLFFITLLYLCSCSKEDTSPIGGTTGDTRDDFVGQWRCQETSQQIGSSVYFVTISKVSANTTQIFIDNFNSFGPNVFVYADVIGTTLTISNQIISGNAVEGSGSLIAGSTITINYTVNDGITTDNVSATLTKQ